MKQIKINIDKNLIEKLFMEALLMYKFAGYDIKFHFFVYAIYEYWNIEKVIYYAKLLEIGK